MEKIDNKQVQAQDELEPTTPETEIALENLDDVNGGGGRVRVLWGLVDVRW